VGGGTLGEKALEATDADELRKEKRNNSSSRIKQRKSFGRQRWTGSAPACVARQLNGAVPLLQDVADRADALRMPVAAEKLLHASSFVWRWIVAWTYGMKRLAFVQDHQQRTAKESRRRRVLLAHRWKCFIGRAHRFQRELQVAHTKAQLLVSLPKDGRAGKFRGPRRDFSVASS